MAVVISMETSSNSRLKDVLIIESLNLIGIPPDVCAADVTVEGIAGSLSILQASHL